MNSTLKIRECFKCHIFRNRLIALLCFAIDDMALYNDYIHSMCFLSR